MSDPSQIGRFIEATKLISSRQFEAAIELLKDLEHELSNLPELHYNLAISYQQLGDYGSAFTYAKNALDLKPNDMNYLKLVAEFSRHINNLEKAIATYMKILDLDPDNLDALHHLGFLYLKAEEMEKAVQYFQNAVDKNTSNTEVLFSLAVLYYQSRREERSIPIFKRLLSLQFRTDEVIDLLVNSYLNLDQLKLAEKILLERYEINPNSKLIKKTAKLYYKMDRPVDALNYIERYIETEPNDMELKLLKAHILREQKENEEALHLYDEILADDENHKSAIKGKAMLLLEMGQVDEANELFERGQKLNQL